MERKDVKVFKAIKISKGKYLYRGYKIHFFGYYEPEHRVVWEGIDNEGDAIAHGFTKRVVMREIDYFMDGV
jgi:hypothetical protein